MSNKHTPAPWHYSPEVSRKSNHLVYGSSEANNNMLIANCGSFGATEDEIKANAHLIASAPELLEALESIIAMHDKKMGKSAVDLRLGLARAAISKAKGQDNENT